MIAFLRTALVAFALMTTVLVGGTGAAAVAGGDDPDGVTTEAPPAPDIIPRPNQGVAPTEAGDRGGALQTVLFVTIIGGIGVIGVLIWRESRRARERRGF